MTIRIDCKLGVEIKNIRSKVGKTLLDMSNETGLTPATLSKYEHNVGALTDETHAQIIETWLTKQGHELSQSAIELSRQSVNIDLSDIQQEFTQARKDKLNHYQRGRDVYLKKPMLLSGLKMLLCPKCGNKHCPKAQWHGYKCTGSNEVGQVGEVEDDQS